MKKDSRRLPLSDWQLQDSERLKAIFHEKRAELGLTQEKLAAELGDTVTQGAVSHFMNGRTALSIKAATVFARALKVRVSQISPTLASRIEEMASSLDHAGRKPVDAPKSAANTPFPAGEDEGVIDDRYAFIPQYDAKAAAGIGHDNPHVEVKSTLAFKRDWLRLKGANPTSLIVIYADGESMWPTIDDHDVLLLDTSKTDPVDGHVFVLANTDKGTIVKRLIKHGSSWIIQSDNPDENKYPDIVLPDGELNEHRIIGRVIWRGGDL